MRRPIVVATKVRFGVFAARSDIVACLVRDGRVVDDVYECVELKLVNADWRSRFR